MVVDRILLTNVVAVTLRRGVAITVEARRSPSRTRTVMPFLSLRGLFSAEHTAVFVRYGK